MGAKQFQAVIVLPPSSCPIEQHTLKTEVGPRLYRPPRQMTSACACRLDLLNAGASFLNRASGLRRRAFTQNSSFAGNQPQINALSHSPECNAALYNEDSSFLVMCLRNLSFPDASETQWSMRSPRADRLVTRFPCC